MFSEAQLVYILYGGLTSQLNFAGDVLLQSTSELRIVLKVVEMMFDPLTENVENPVWQRR